MSLLSPPDPAAPPSQQGRLWLVMAVVLVLAQALLLHHQVEHVGSDAGAQCLVCISGGSLDHAATASPGVSSAVTVFGAVTLVRYVGPRPAATRHADARAPPSVRDA
jgi:hypothetical protein